ncbi:MAG: glycosyltransferase [Planctomycetes bacterium]|nr:glycosyltransferase [Planctomycetota bacterium]
MLAPFVPSLRATHGGGIYLATLAQALKHHAELGLVALTHDPAPTDRPDPEWSWQATALLPRRRRGSAGLPHRMRMLWRWRSLPLVAAKHWQPTMPTLLGRAIREFRPHVALVELAQMAQYLPYLDGIPTILTDHEGGCPANTTTGLGPWGDRRDAALWRRYVRHFYPLASAVQTVTFEDARELSELLGQPVHVRRPTFAVPMAPVEPGRAPRRALFLGDYSHRPNPEAAAMLVRDILPLLRADDPSTELWLAGPNQERVRQLGDAAGVKLLGFVPDLHRLFGEVRLVLAPLLSGSGFRMKALAALAHGLPVVTNALGARGCDAEPPARTIAEGPRELADAALRLLRSPDDAAAAGRAAFAWAKRNLTADAVAADQIEQVQRLLGIPTAV